MLRGGREGGTDEGEILTRYTIADFAGSNRRLRIRREDRDEVVVEQAIQYFMGGMK